MKSKELYHCVPAFIFEAIEAVLREFEFIYLFIQVTGSGKTAHFAQYFKIELWYSG